MVSATNSFSADFRVASEDFEGGRIAGDAIDGCLIRKIGFELLSTEIDLFSKFNLTDKNFTGFKWMDC